MLKRAIMGEGIEHYYVFADDHQVYGPANHELLQQWAQENLVSMETWIFHEPSHTWKRAREYPVLDNLLVCPTPLPKASASAAGIRGGQLRRIRLFADMTDEQAEKFVGLLEKVKIRAFSPIVKQGEHGDFMFLILDGEARVSVRTSGKEDVIAVLGVGDFFGEVALLDQGPRSTDVFANKDCVLLRLSKENFERIMKEHTELANRFLLAMNRILGTRIRATNERFANAQNFARGVSGQITAPSSMKWNRGY